MKTNRTALDSGGPHLDSKVDGLVTHCLYLIATGKWEPGTKLPSIRQGEAMWELNRLTVQKAYRRLEEMGLIRSRTKSGYYVGHEAGIRQISRHRYALENFFHDISKRISDELELSPLGVFRYMARMAEIVSSENPEIAFVECTRQQAEGHAREIIERLKIPMMSFTTGEIMGKRSRIPSHVRTLFTTYFHLGEFQEMKAQGDLQVFAVPIEVSPELKRELSEFCGKVIFLEIEDVQASHISRDSRGIMEDLDLETRVVTDVELALEQIQADAPEARILLSPRVWGSVSERWRQSPGIKPVQFRICPSAWQDIAEKAGLPLGDN